MTESDWLAAFSPRALLRLLPGYPEPSERKLRLFGVACARRVAVWLSHPVWSDVLDVCERYADDGVTWQTFSRLGRVVERHAPPMTWGEAEDDAVHMYHYAAAVSALADMNFYAEYVTDSCRDALCDHDDFYAGRGEMLYQADLLRDIFGNPFRPVALAPEWRTATAVGLAQAIYAGRTFGDLPILADALEDAGGDAAELLAHCRDTARTHVRGCWAVDLVLGKA